MPTMLQIVPFLVPGAANHALNLVKVFPEFRHVVVHNPDLPQEGLLSSPSLWGEFRLWQTGLFPLPVFKRSIFRWAYASGALCGLFRRYQPSLVISHTGYCSMIAETALRISGNRRSEPAGGRINGTPLHLSVVHGWGLKKTWLQKRSDCFALNRCNRVIAVSRAIERQMLSEGINREKLVTIPYGYPVRQGNHRDIRPELGINKDTVVVLSAGRLVEEKNPFLLLDIASACRNFPVLFALAGEGPLKSALQDRISRESLPVKLLGFRDDVRDLMASSDIFILTSKYDALPFALIEALFHGLPVVATRAGGIPEMLDNGRSGILFDTAPEAASAISLLLDPVSRSRFRPEA
ncbi:MAG: glycosyltransferase, partial [Candidatus Wallbacteria bacterium]|nr:glycosyltransferase [Candidatus Wallbacteria bacterium]